MAILIEEEKRNINWFAILIVLIILGLISTAVIYMFFISPESIEVLVPDNLKNIQDLSETKFDPAEIFKNPAFSKLKLQTPLVVPEPAFNQNPFLQ
ncbi:MAG: hypothetical protein AAB596_02180 [Patescibacteria group bacterium]